MASVIRRRYLGGAAAALGGLLAAACGEVEVRYVQGPAGPAGPGGAQGERGSTGAAGASGASGAAGQTQTIVQEKVVTVEVEKPVIVEKVVDRPVVVEKQVVVEKPAERIVPKKLEFWAVDYADGSALNYGRKAMHDNVRRWNEQSNDSFVSLNPRPSGHHMEKLIASYAAGTQPQLILWPSWHAGLFAIAGVLVDVQDRFIKADKNFAAQLDDFYEPVLQSMYFRGKLFSLEIAPNADLPYTNLNLVREAGLEPLELGYTWDDLADYCVTMQGALGPGRESNKWAIAHMRNAAVFANLFKQAGGEMYNGDYTKVGYNSPEGLDAAQFIHDLHHKYQVHRPHGDYFKEAGKPNSDFRKGEIGMYYETSRYRILTFAEAIGGMENMYVSPPPKRKDPFVISFGRGVQMVKNPPEIEDASWEVHKFMVAADQAAHYSAIEYFLPNRRSTRETPEYQAALENAPPFQVFLDALDNYSFRPAHPAYFEHYVATASLLDDIGKTPNLNIKDAVAETARKLDLLLEKFNREQADRL